MLRNLLHLYAEMCPIGDARLHCVIVDNNDRPTLQGIVEDFRERLAKWPVQYVLETRLDVAFARNCALDCALSAGDDLLTFADDDETVQPDWLVHLLAERDASDLDIVGSPVRFAPPSSEASFWQILVWSGMDRINRNSETKLLHLRNREGRPNIACDRKLDGQSPVLFPYRIAL